MRLQCLLEGTEVRSPTGPVTDSAGGRWFHVAGPLTAKVVAVYIYGEIFRRKVEIQKLQGHLKFGNEICNNTNDVHVI